MNGHIWRLLEDGEIVNDGDEVYVGYWQRAGIAGTMLSRHHSIHRRCVTAPPWPAPRDAKTDPATLRDAIGGSILGLSESSKQWTACAWDWPHITHWLPLPPLPKSEAEKAWEAYCAVHGTPVSGFSKDLYIRGFNAGKGSK